MGTLFGTPEVQMQDGNGAVYAGAKAYFYDPGTTDARTVYTDNALSVAHAQPVVADSSGRFAAIYLPTGTYRVIIKDSTDATTISDVDNIEGHDPTSSVSVTTALPVRNVLSKTTTYTTTATDNGKFINANPTGGTFTITLVAASTAGDGGMVKVRHTGSANAVNIAYGGASDWTLNNLLDEAEFISDGSDWHVSDIVPDDSITLAKMAGGTDGEIITYDASGDPTTVAVGTADQVLTSNGAGAAPTMQYPMANYTETELADPFVSDGTEYDTAHGLGAHPSLVMVYLEAKSLDAGYAAGDRIWSAGGRLDSTAARGIEVSTSTTNVHISVGTSTIEAIHKTANTAGTLTEANWKMGQRVWA